MRWDDGRSWLGGGGSSIGSGSSGSGRGDRGAILFVDLFLLAWALIGGGGTFIC